MLFLAFGHLSFFRVVLYGFVAAIGTLVGLEIPLLMRMLRDQLAFKDLVARVLTFDYIGALLASLLFPLLLVPRLGLVRTAWSSGCSTPPSGSGARTCSGCSAPVPGICGSRRS